MPEKNIPLNAHRHSYLNMRVQQVLGIIGRDGMVQAACAMNPELQGPKPDLNKVRDAIEAAATTLAGAEFDTGTQYAPNREALLQALAKVRLRETPRAPAQAISNDVIIPDFSAGQRGR